MHNYTRRFAYIYLLNCKNPYTIQNPSVENSLNCILCTSGDKENEMGWGRISTLLAQ